MGEFIDQRLGGQLDGEWCVIGYNVQFDLPMVTPIFETVKSNFCVLKLARRTYPTGPENHKLATMVEYLQLAGGTAHRALGDCHSTLLVMKHIFQEKGMNLLDELKVPARTIYRMPWGEHQGKLLIEVPVHYRRWLLARDNLDPDLRRSLMQLRGV